jgi:hypothetical protein
MMTGEVNNFNPLEKNNDTSFLGFAKKLSEENIKILEERNVSYGDNFEIIGKILMDCLTQEGKAFTLTTGQDFNRFAMFTQIALKMTRYAQNFGKGGHKDSLDDLINYTVILQYLDSKNKEDLR